jgi:hypothetical protein
MWAGASLVTGDESAATVGLVPEDPFDRIYGRRRACHLTQPRNSSRAKSTAGASSCWKTAKAARLETWLSLEGHQSQLFAGRSHAGLLEV